MHDDDIGLAYTSFAATQSPHSNRYKKLFIKDDIFSDTTSTFNAIVRPPDPVVLVKMRDTDSMNSGCHSLGWPPERPTHYHTYYNPDHHDHDDPLILCFRLTNRTSYCVL